MRFLPGARSKASSPVSKLDVRTCAMSRGPLVRRLFATAARTADRADQAVDPDRRDPKKAGIGLAELENDEDGARDRGRPEPFGNDADDVECVEDAVAEKEQRRPSDDHH